jgi:flagellar biosynthetic protein FliP
MTDLIDSVATWPTVTSPERLLSALHIVAAMTALSLVPAMLLMTTSYVRIMVVLSLLRQAMGTPQMPPNQVIAALSLFMTLLIMSPVWRRVHQEAVVPYSEPGARMTFQEACAAGIQPVRQFMSQQIEAAGNSDDVVMFLDHLPPGTPTPETYGDVPLQALLPAFLLSELKTAFLIGFQIYLPFVILDIVVASVTISMGMFMLPPAVVSLPLKLLLFVLVDGWHLVVGTLLESFSTMG